VTIIYPVLLWGARPRFTCLAPRTICLLLPVVVHCLDASRDRRPPPSARLHVTETQPLQTGSWRTSEVVHSVDASNDRHLQTVGGLHLREAPAI
jgi:predicted lipoprotein